MKKTENETEQQKELMRRKVMGYDDVCLKELEEVFEKHKGLIKKLLEGGLDE